MQCRCVSMWAGVSQIDLSGNNLRAEGAKVLGPAIAVAGALTVADLQNNGMDDASKQLLRDAVKDRTNLALKL